MPPSHHAHHPHRAVAQVHTHKIRPGRGEQGPHTCREERSRAHGRAVKEGREPCPLWLFLDVAPHGLLPYVRVSTQATTAKLMTFRILLLFRSPM